MAMKRCPDCGEKYSDTYKYCPFCEEEEVLRKGKDRGGRRARQSRHFSVLIVARYWHDGGQWNDDAELNFGNGNFNVRSTGCKTEL